MKKLMLLAFFLCWLQFSWSQKKKSFFYADAKLTKVLSDVEEAFDVKYSYVDSLVIPQRFSLPKKLYALDEINNEIEKQSTLKIIRINERFYSLNKTETNETDSSITLLKEVIVEEFLAKGIQKTNQHYSIFPQKVQTLPGITDADILQSLQQLPGVKSPNETATGLYIRGGTSDQNLILMDGIRLYHPGHLFGMISSINPNVEQTVDYYNKAVNPRFGERVSGIIDIKSTDKISDKLKINAGINALNADVYLKSPLIKDKLGLQFSARKSYTEWLQSPTFNQLERKVFQNTDFKGFDNDNQFQFYDYSAKLNFKPNPKTEISLSGLVIKNNLDYKSTIKTDSISNQRMNIENYGFSLNWTQKYTPKFKQQTLIYYSLYSFDYLKKKDYDINKFEAFKKLNRVVDSGAELRFGYQMNEQSNLDFGYQVFGNDISHLFNSYNQDVGIDLGLRHLYNVTHAGYVHYQSDFGSWNIQPGLRYNFYSQIKASSFEPRLMLQKKLSKSLIWQVSCERRSQILSQVRENAANDLSLENYVWILSDNGEYPIQKANQFASGIIFKKNNWLLDVDAYYKNITGITSYTLGFLGQNDNDIHHGKGFTKGVDVLLQKSHNSWRAWMTYTYQDSQNKFEALNDGNYFSSNADIKHNFTIALNKKWKNFLFTTGWFWHSGKPFSTVNNSGEITSYNSERLPDYHRLDISASYQFQNQKKNFFKVGVSVYNVYNHSDLISKEFERKYASLSDFITPRYTMQNYYTLGIMPNVFFRVNF
ncbi:TonB-dependent receptor plug domain-containing protein [Flavobacterium sp. AS60]|uniref:TonB-dependent receptor plug domain-containing protein n=1 Tax=Flavobacterium anseongense TaxID=2910677 RepID=UPI001F1F5F14|nr:TonB-dependent receptor plug domain-containing protein [Flavobacterium sp. AS60]MCF6129951.1 TonB-dependent receptor plug domain-containing protein [Flavobacterium sp. AS60]